MKILVITPRHLTAAPSNLQVAVQRRVLDVLAQQIMLSGIASSTNMDLRRSGLKTPHHPTGVGSHLTHQMGNYLRGAWQHLPTRLFQPRFISCSVRAQYASWTFDAAWLPAGEGLFCVDQDPIPMYDAHV
jgi:hypothetical protein